MADNEGTARSSGFMIVCDTPDVCKSPSAPIPYNIVAFLDQSILTSTDVNFQGFPVFDMMSRVSRVIGNEAGIGGGLVSVTNLGMCRPTKASTTVRCNGNYVCRHMQTKFEMNCLGTHGAGNTTGTVIYLGAMMSGPVGPGGSLPASANAALSDGKPGELSALEQIANSLNVSDVGDVMALAQQGYQLSQVDWNNPTAALGALSGMAGRAGLKDLSAGIGLANKAANTDFSDLGSLASLAGDASALGASVSKNESMAEFARDLGFLDTAMNTEWDDPAAALAAAAGLAGPIMNRNKPGAGAANSGSNDSAAESRIPGNSDGFSNTAGGNDDVTKPFAMNQPVSANTDDNNSAADITQPFNLSGKNLPNKDQAAPLQGSGYQASDIEAAGQEDVTEPFMMNPDMTKPFKLSKSKMVNSTKDSPGSGSSTTKKDNPVGDDDDTSG